MDACNTYEIPRAGRVTIRVKTFLQIKTVWPAAITSVSAMGKPQSGASAAAPTPLSIAYPVNSYVELSISSPSNGKLHGREEGGADGAMQQQQQQMTTIKGLVYTTDRISNTVVLLRSLPNPPHHDVHIINASSIIGCELLAPQPLLSASSLQQSSSSSISPVNSAQLEERERRAIRLATETLTQININATPRAQIIFDLLAKGCNVVSWGEGNSIVVLNQVRVDAPYKPETCIWIGLKAGEKETKSLEEGSLERVKRIVGSKS